MSILSRIGAAVGIGNCEVSLALSQSQVFRGEMITGIAHLAGGSVEQRLKMLTVDLIEWWVTGSGKNRTTHNRNRGRVTLIEDHLSVPGSEESFPFSIRLPEDARCTRRREGWYLQVEAHVPMAVDARFRVPLVKVLPHKEILAVQRAIRDGLHLIPHMWDGSGNVIQYNFIAPEELKNRIDGLSLRLWVEGPDVRAEIGLNLQEQGFGDVLSSLVGGNRDLIQLTFPRERLLSKRQTPNPAGALPALRTLFERLDLEPHAA